MPFCSHCGTELKTESSFCSKCGIKLAPEARISKVTTWTSGFSIVVGILILLGGVAFSNYYNAILGIALFVIGFVSLKNTSKTVSQLIMVSSFILAVIAIINLFKL